MAKVRLHLGAHKTATTRLQACLYQSRALFDARDISFLSVSDCRGLFEPDLRQTGNGRKSIADAAEAIRGRLFQMVTPDTDIVLSYENALGGMGDSLSPGPIGYGQAEPRLSLLLAVFAEWDVSILYGIREFGGYFSSAYSEAARNYETRLPQEISTAILGDHMIWSNLLARLRGCHPYVPITVFRHEDYRDNERQILELVSGLPAEAFGPLPDEDHRSALSKLAARAIVTARPFTAPKRYRDKMAFSSALEAAFPVTASNPKVDLWTKTQKRKLEEAYAQDVQRIAAMPGIDLLTI